MHRNDIRNGAPAGVALSEHSAARSAVPDSDNQFGIGYSIIGAFQGLFHIHGYGTRDQQQVGMSRACDEFDPDAFEVVVGIVERLNLQFASIAGAGIDVANTEGAAQDLPQIFLKRFDRPESLREELAEAPSRSPCESCVRERQTWLPHPSCPL